MCVDAWPPVTIKRGEEGAAAGARDRSRRRFRASLASLTPPVAAQLWDFEMARFVGSCDRDAPATRQGWDPLCGPLVPRPDPSEDADEHGHSFMTSVPLEAVSEPSATLGSSPPSLHLVADPRYLAGLDTVRVHEPLPSSPGSLRSSPRQMPVGGPEVTAIAFLEPYAAMVVGDSAGQLQVWTIPPHPARCHMVATWTHHPLSGTRGGLSVSSRPPAITCMSMTRINPLRHKHAANALGKEHIERCESWTSGYCTAGLGGRQKRAAHHTGRTARLWSEVKNRLGEGVAFAKRMEVGVMRNAGSPAATGL